MNIFEAPDEHATPAPAVVTYRSDRRYAARQRAIDIAVASAALVATAPVLAAASLAIWLEDRGPALFTQERVGRFGRLFTIYKLRTMRMHAGDALSPTDRGDRRITRVGRWLRRLSIDELPQFVNVIRGDMSIVGPRPEMPFVVRNYERWQHLRHLARPGITGLWQTTVRKRLPLHTPAATAIDLEYISNASTAMDGRLVLATFGVLLTTSGAF